MRFAIFICGNLECIDEFKNEAEAEEYAYDAAYCAAEEDVQRDWGLDHVDFEEIGDDEYNDAVMDYMDYAVIPVPEDMSDREFMDEYVF